MADRDRDEQGRPLNARPRDGLGRPLPRGAEGVPRIPDDLELPPGEAITETQRLLDHEQPFHAHEVLESVWKSCPPEERALWQGLAQLAVGLTHLLRGNRVGARSLMAQAHARIRLYETDPPYDLDITGLMAWAEHIEYEIDADRPLEPVPVPRLRVP
ncbi:DUF309 domain-containing protein [Rhodococcus sp. HNM0569]|uniref:DUF309 domain-containing protein n=1 Tax=Rhodococcus sp. HNM0569 TaxID=2716340 RepID=UPI00146CB005|nr:DUF309 domain-containing protein [Rhodococcus sp. HNM0569]NLU84615.1 DUF309 domain-containing protein [Rhodococcus sp. HNM0569]